MPDWKITASRTFGRGQVIGRDIIVEDIDNVNLARVKGIDEVMQWANEEDSPIPVEALNYWNEKKGGAINPWEVLTELENRWNLTFTVQDMAQVETAQPTTEAPAVHQRPPIVRNGRASTSPAIPPVFDFTAMMGMVQARYAYLMEERKRIDAELAEIGKFAVAMPQEKKRRRARKVKGCQGQEISRQV